MDANAVSFGRAKGQAAQLFTLDNGSLKACIMDYAGALVSLEAPDRNGRAEDVVLGFDDVAGYVDNRGSFGALLGRTSNRIAGGRFTVDGNIYELSKNEGENTLHGGAEGFDKQFWWAEEATPQHVKLSLTSRDGDQGFPGEVSVEATWRLDGSSLLLEFTAKTTKPTPLSLSAHPYFNLDGPSARDCLDHEVEIFAEAFLPTDQQQIPTGEIGSVAGTPFDFRTMQPISARIREPEEQLRFAKGYDHCFVRPDQRDGLSLTNRTIVWMVALSSLLAILETEPTVEVLSTHSL